VTREPGRRPHHTVSMRGRRRHRVGDRADVDGVTPATPAISTCSCVFRSRVVCVCALFASLFSSSHSSGFSPLTCTRYCHPQQSVCPRFRARKSDRPFSVGRIRHVVRDRRDRGKTSRRHVCRRPRVRSATVRGAVAEPERGGRRIGLPSTRAAVVEPRRLD